MAQLLLRKFQLFAEEDGANLQLSDEVVNVSTSSENAIAGIRVNTDGTIDKRELGIYTQIDSATDWIIPNGAASSSYEFRITSVTFNIGSVFFIQAAAANTWINMAAAREWTVQDANPFGDGEVDVDFLLEVRLGSSGSAITNGSYTLKVNYEF